MKRFWYTSRTPTQHGRASGRRAKKRWSDSSLQVEDPKASATPTSLPTTCATFLGSATTVVAHSTWRMDLSQRRSTSPLSTCILMLNRRVRCRNVAGRMTSHHSWSRHPCSAAHTAQQPRREPLAIPTAYGHGYRGGHLGSLQQPYETISVCPSDLLLALDAPSAGVTGTVVYDAIRTHTRSQNTCNVKSGRLPVHLGLDHAADMPVCLHLAPPLPGGRAGLPSQI